MDTIVYRAAPGRSTEEVLRALQQHGLHPRALSEPDAEPILRYAAKGTATVPIAVPQHEAPSATEVLRARERRQTQGLARAPREFRWQLLAAAALGIAATLAFGLLRTDGFGETAGQMIQFLLVGITGFGFAALVLVAQLVRVRRRLIQGGTAGRDQAWRRWACRILLVGMFDAPFTDGDPPVRRSRRPRRRKRQRTRH